MFGRLNNPNNRQAYPQLDIYAGEASRIVMQQAPLVLEKTTDQGQIEGPLNKEDARKDIRFQGNSYANRGFFDDDPAKDTFVSYMQGARVDTSEANVGPKVKIKGPVHILEMQGAYQQASPENDIPTEVRFQIVADLGSGAIKLTQQTSRANQKKPNVERLEGVAAWERAMPYVKNLSAVLQAKDPALGLPENLPLPSTAVLEMNEEQLYPLFEQIDRKRNPGD